MFDVRAAVEKPEPCATTDIGMRTVVRALPECRWAPLCPTAISGNFSVSADHGLIFIPPNSGEKIDAYVRPATNRLSDLSDKRVGLRGATVEEAFMLNRSTVIGVAIALAAVLVGIVLVQPAIGPQASRANLAGPSTPIDNLHRQVDPNKLPIQSAPEP
jgi:hypothetical protein